jgi:tetratricopeptide (TPR) repeat protein
MKAAFKTLVLSFGSGVTFAAGLRLAEKLSRRSTESRSRLKARGAALESPIQIPETILEASSLGYGADLRMAGRRAWQRLGLLHGASARRVSRLERRVEQVESTLPHAIGSAVDALGERLQSELREAQARALEPLLAALQARLVERIAAVESHVAGQAEALAALRAASVRTDESLRRMLSATEALRQNPPAISPNLQPSDAEPSASPHREIGDTSEVQLEPFRLQAAEQAKGRNWVPAAVVIGACAVAIIALYSSSWFDTGAAYRQPVHEAAPESVKGTSVKLQILETRAAADPDNAALLLELGREYASLRRWREAEKNYRQALNIAPENRDIILALADALYAQKKYEESAAMLARLSAQPGPR